MHLIFASFKKLTKTCIYLFFASVKKPKSYGTIFCKRKKAQKLWNYFLQAKKNQKLWK